MTTAGSVTYPSGARGYHPPPPERPNMATIIKSSNKVRRAPFNAAQMYQVSKCCPSSKRTIYTSIPPPAGSTYLSQVSRPSCHIYTTGLRSCDCMLYPALHVLELQAVSEIDAAREASQARWRNELLLQLQSEELFEIQSQDQWSDVLRDYINPRESLDRIGCFPGGEGCERIERPEYRFYQHLVTRVGELDPLFKIFEAYALTVHFMSKAETFKEKSIVWMNYISVIYEKSFTGIVVSSAITQFAVHLFSDLYGDEVQSEDEGCLHILRDCLNNYTLVKNSPIYKKVYRFILYGLSLSLFEKLGISFESLRFEELEAEAIRKKHHMGVDFVFTSLDTLLFIAEKAQQYMVTKSIHGIFVSEAKFQVWYDESAKLIRQSQYLTNPELHGIEVHSYLNDVNKAIEIGKYIKNFSSTMTTFEKSTVSKNLQDLENVRCMFINRTAAAKDRKAPFSVLVYGGSSVGKSSIIHTIFVHFGKVFGLNTAPEFKYTRLAHEKHWSNFSTEKWCIVLDDVAMIAPKACQGIDPSLAEVILLNNNVAFTPEQAALEDKGKTPAIPKLLIATTNTSDLNVHAYFSCPLAISRRMPWVIDVKPKPEYTKDACMLDGSAVPIQEDGTYNNFWIFEIFRVVPQSSEREGQRGTLQIVHTFDDINDFLAWMSKEAVAHDKQQDKVMSSNNVSQEVEICLTCYRAKLACVCNLEMQSVDIYDCFWLSLCLTFCTLVYKYFNNVVMYFFFKYAYSTTWRYVLDKTRIIHLLSLSAFYVTTSNASTIFCYLGHRINTTPKTKLLSKLILVLASILGAYHMYSYFKPDPVKKVVKDLIKKGKEIEKTEQKLEKLNKEDDVLCKRLTKLIPCNGPKPFVEESEDVAYDEPLNSTSEPIVVSYTDRGSAPEPAENERVNVWYNSVVPLSKFDVGSKSIGLQGMSRDFVSDLLGKNTVLFKSTRVVGGRLATKFTRGICVVGHIYMCNDHGLPSDMDFELEVINSQIGVGISTNLPKFAVHQSEIRRDPKYDLAFIQINKLPSKRDIRQYMAKSILTQSQDGFYLGRNKEGAVVTNDMAHCLHTVYPCPDGITRDMYLGYSSTQCVIGDCGSVLIMETGYGPVISGIHLLGRPDSNVALCVAITQDIVARNISTFEEFQMQSHEPMLSAPSAKRGLIELHPKCVMRFIEDGIAEVYGSYSGFKPNPKSHVQKSVIAQSLVDRGFEIKHGPPLMRGYKPWRIAAVDMAAPVTGLDTVRLEKCVQAFTTEILSSLSKTDLKDVKVYDDFTAVNGCAGVAYVDKINHNTSAGVPWKKSKKHFLNTLPPERGFDAPVEFNDEIKSRSIKIIEQYEAGFLAAPIFCGNLKDEAKTFKKIASGGTRVFSGSPADWSHVVRKYYLSMVRLIQNKRFVFESAPGTVAQSTEWEQIREYLTFFSDLNLVAGDYKAFDKRMPMDVILAAFKILFAIAKASGNYSEEDLRVLRGIAEDTASPLIDFNGDLIKFLGGNPSGHPLTVIINGLVNCLYMRYVFDILGEEHNVSVFDFKRFVHLITYGDDNAMGVSPKTSWFNHTAIQAELGKIGIVYTMADKEAQSVPFIPISKVSFLKREWKWDADVGAYLCPLEWDSIIKMLTVNVMSKSVSPRFQAIQTIGTAVRECFYYGKDKFEEMTALLKEVVTENELDCYVEDSTFPSWESLREKFWESSKGIPLMRLHNA